MMASFSNMMASLLHSKSNCTLPVLNHFVSAVVMAEAELCKLEYLDRKNRKMYFKISGLLHYFIWLSLNLRHTYTPVSLTHKSPHAKIPRKTTPHAKFDVWYLSPHKVWLGVSLSISNVVLKCLVFTGLYWSFVSTGEDDKFVWQNVTKLERTDVGSDHTEKWTGISPDHYRFEPYAPCHS